MRRSKAKDGSTILDGGSLTLATAIAALYPIGSIYMTTVATNPGTGSPAQFPGTTWAAFGAGRAVVGVGSNGTNTYASEQTFGADTCTLTAAQCSVNAHTHSQTLAAPDHTHSGASHTHGLDWNYIVGPNPSGTGFNFAVSIGGTFNTDGSDSNGNTDAANIGTTSSPTATALTGSMGAVASPTGATAHDIRQTSIAVYLWKRTA